MAKYNSFSDADFSGVEREERWYGGSLRFAWNYDDEELIERLGIGKQLNKYMANVCASYCEPFVPYATGDLAHYVQVFGAADHGTITYQKPYASKQYFLDGGGHYLPDNSKRTRTWHELATSEWDKFAWQMYKYDIIEDVDEERRRLSYG